MRKSYKCSAIVNYDASVIPIGNFCSQYDANVAIYKRRIIIVHFVRRRITVA